MTRTDSKCVLQRVKYIQLAMLCDVMRCYAMLFYVISIETFTSTLVCYLLITDSSKIRSARFDHYERVCNSQYKGRGQVRTKSTPPHRWNSRRREV